ncbi:hypothetical protein BD413DRAFT_541034 [Trametes elegans]|nr:hypothetical protein BD413DRAFT_541034 [Trametes elegans]
MAFPIPSHLPRKQDVRDVSTQVLTKISEATFKDLNAVAASSWVAELDDTIRLTKNHIHGRISSDLPNFERQHASSVSVQERFQSLSQSVNQLNENLFSSESGLVPNLITTLTSHSALAQASADARARHGALAHLLRCRDALEQLERLAEDGQLPDATRAGASLEGMLSDAPEPLRRSEVMSDLKRRCTALRNRTEEQLMHAYSRSVIVSAAQIVVRPSVEGGKAYVLHNGQWIRSLVEPGPPVTFPLSGIMASMSPPALAAQVSTLRRDIVAHCIEYVLKQPVTIYQSNSVDISGPVEHKISMHPPPPREEDITVRLERLTTIMRFLAEHLIPHLPEPERKALALSLSSPLRSAILDQLLLPNIPSALAGLPDYLKLANRAVRAEEEIVVEMLGDTSGERSVKSWVDSVGLHYERKRRAEVLDKARVVVVTPQDDSSSFRVEVPLVLEEPGLCAQPETVEASTNGHAKEGKTNGVARDAVVEEETENAWDFEDDVEPEQEPVPEVEVSAPSDAVSDPSDGTAVGDDDPWGWNEDPSPTTADDEPAEDAWDDAWDEKPSKPEPVILEPPPAARPARGLQKFSKSVPNSPMFPPPTSPSIPVPLTPQPDSAKNSAKIRALAPLAMKKPPVKVTESFLVSGRTKDLLQLVEDVLREGADLVSSGILNTHVSHSPGSVIMQAAPMALELFRALVPVVNANALQQSAKEPMQFSNDCRFVEQELQRIVSKLSGPKVTVRDQLEEALETLKVLAGSWFEDAIIREEQQIEQLLGNARGFIDTNHQERYDECESALNDVLQRIRRVAPQWKAVLAKSKYYDALGAVVETAVSRVLGDVLALEDITEIESHRLSELCHTLNALEGLFVEDPNHPSFVVSYVPSWLKFSYLSELLEASIADISYLFEEGALVDFEINELVKLVRALFADTPLRANTINRLLQGHPVRRS